MLRGEFESAGELSPAALRTAYLDRLRETIDRRGVDDVTAQSDVDAAVVEALAAGESPELTLEAAAGILATEADAPPAETLAADARDILLMGMTTAVVDVDALAAGVDADVDPKEIQQKIEGRFPMTLDEYAAVHAYLERQ